MTGRALRKFQKELNSGTVALVLLRTLERAGEPMYGYEIARLLTARAGDRLAIKQGPLYAVLRSLEAQGLAESSLQPSDSGPPRKYYAITTPGRAALAEWSDAWRGLREFVDEWLEDDA